MKIVKSTSTTNDKSFTDSGLSENYGMFTLLKKKISNQNKNNFKF